jgi:uridine kinase
MTPRTQVLADLTALVMAVDQSHPVRVGIDGWSAAGKTTLAGELVAAINAAGRSAVQASLDDFKTAVVRRGRYPTGSAEEYYYEMYDHQAIRSELLEPLGPGGDRSFRTATFDQQRQADLPVVRETVPPDAIVVVDGCFLYRTRYIPGEQLYLQAVRPHTHADVILDNRDLTHPVLRIRDA